MADNTDEEHLNTPTGNQSENLRDDIIPNNNKEAVHPNQETENMEVHHHAHHEGKKNWKSYFWEFLMLFLAVFCGFLAEYRLEHVIEQNKEKQYIESMIENLKTDTSSLTRTINSNIQKEAFLDSLLSLEKEDLSTPVTTRNFYSYFIKGAFQAIFRTTDATIIQLKNSGNFRLIRSIEVTDSILNYDRWNQTIVDHNEKFAERNDEIWNAAYPIMQGWIMADTSFIMNREVKQTALPRLENNNQHKQVFFGMLARGILFTRVNRTYLIQHKLRAERLISFLENTYHINHE
jgi:hypothetical protein